MSIEHFRPESQRPLDADGFELPPWLNPFLSDYCPELAEPAAADVAWLASNPTLPPIAGGSPDPEPYHPTEQDWADYSQYRAEEAAVERAARDEWHRRLEEIRLASEWQDRLEAIYGAHGITDDDLTAAGLPVG